MCTEREVHSRKQTTNSIKFLKQWLCLFNSFYESCSKAEWLMELFGYFHENENIWFKKCVKWMAFRNQTWIPKAWWWMKELQGEHKELLLWCSATPPQPAFPRARKTCNRCSRTKPSSPWEIPVPPHSCSLLSAHPRTRKMLDSCVSLTGDF